MSTSVIIVFTLAHLLIGLAIGLWIRRRQWSRSATAQQKLHEQQVEGYMKEARTDALTEVMNRRGFDEVLRRRVGERQRRKTPVSLIVLDVDRFKTFNDEHGHHVGDEILRSIGRILFNQLREFDVVARIGGDEFAAILLATELDDAACVAERMRRAVATTEIRVEEMLVRATVSVGVAEAIPGETSDSLFKRTDAAVYASKRGGRNRVHQHDGQSVLAGSIGEFEH